MLAGRNGARGRIRTCTGDALDFVSLHWTTRAKVIGASSRGCSGRNSLQKKSAGVAWRRRSSLTLTIGRPHHSHRYFVMPAPLSFEGSGFSSELARSMTGYGQGGGGGDFARYGTQ